MFSFTKSALLLSNQTDTLPHVPGLWLEKIGAYSTAHVILITSTRVFNESVLQIELIRMIDLLFNF